MASYLRMVWLASLASAVLVGSSLAEATAGDPIDLTPQITANDLAQVTLELAEGGQLLVAASRDDEAESKEVSMSVAATLRYEEHRFPPESAQDGDLPTASVRYYNQPEVVIKIDDQGTTPAFSDQRRLITSRYRAGTRQLSSPWGPLSREELDLIDVPGDSLIVDRLLPKTPVADGDTWTSDSALIGALLCLDSVAHCETTCVLDKHNDDFALIKLEGTAMGTVDDATTEVELRGVLLFDRRQRRVTRLNLAAKENRSIGGATRGVDSVSKLRLTIRPIDAPQHLTADVLASLESPGKALPELLRLDARKQGFRVLYDRRWFITARERETVTLRRVEGGDVVAHSTITRLPAKSAERQTTLAEFERDIRRALGKNFGHLVSSRQWTNAFKHRCLEVVVRGSAEDVPVEWHYYLVAPEGDGHRVTVAVTIDGRLIEQLAGADRQLVHALELVSDEQRVADSTGLVPDERSLVVPPK